MHCQFVEVNVRNTLSMFVAISSRIELEEVYTDEVAQHTAQHCTASKWTAKQKASNSIKKATALAIVIWNVSYLQSLHVASVLSLSCRIFFFSMLSLKSCMETRSFPCHTQCIPFACIKLINVFFFVNRMPNGCVRTTYYALDPLIFFFLFNLMNFKEKKRNITFDKIRASNSIQSTIKYQKPFVFRLVDVKGNEPYRQNSALYDKGRTTTTLAV